MDWDNLVTDAVAQRMEANKPIWNLIAAIKQDSTLDPNTKRAHLRRLHGCLSDKDVHQKMVADALDYGVGRSFRASLNHLRRLKMEMRTLGTNIFPGGNPKLRDREFAASLGVPVPKTLASNVPLNEVELVANTVLKPVKGSSTLAVFRVDENLHLTSIRTSKTYRDISEAWGEISKHSHLISDDCWMTEQLILGPSGKPANDLKVYAFYGTLGMFLEIERGPRDSAKYATYDRRRKRIQLGPTYEEFEGSGVPDSVYELATRISLASPVPFLRIDFHLGNDGLYLGEITPHPGGTYAGALYEEVDKSLGSYFDKAYAKLIIDLLNGKTFPLFKKAYGVEYVNYAL